MPRPCLLLALLLVTGCRAPAPEEPPVRWDPAHATGDILMRQRIEGTFDGHTARMEAAVQKRGDTLTVIGLTPFGTKAFVLEQRGREVTFTSHAPEGQGPPLRPRHLLADLHHAFFLGLPDSSSKLPMGEREGVVAGEPVTERWVGHLLEREFDGDVRVTYEGGWGRPASALVLSPPRDVRVENERYGYDLRVETLSWQRLEE